MFERLSSTAEVVRLYSRQPKAYDRGSIANRRKHGIGSEQAAMVFRDSLAVSIYDEDHSEAEERWITLGQTDHGPLMVVVYTYQAISATDTAVRIISARRATANEQRDYEQNR
jgi:uncharacterized DUF497 family protein